MNIIYQEHSADEVVRYFIEGFKPKPGQGTILRHDFFFDPNKKVFVLKLFLEEPKKQG